MSPAKEKTASELARALDRYNRMRRPENAYLVLTKEWPSEIVTLVEWAVWEKVKAITVSEAAREGEETLAVMLKAHKLHVAVQKKRRARSGARASAV